MTEVRVEIAGRPYQLTCAAGEEEHITMLASTINDKIGDQAGQQGLSEARTLMFAALILADELHDAQKLGSSGQSVPTAAPAASLPPIAEPLEALAEKLEALADELTKKP